MTSFDALNGFREKELKAAHQQMTGMNEHESGRMAGGPRPA